MTARLFQHRELENTLWVAGKMFLYGQRTVPSLACNYLMEVKTKKSLVTVKVYFE
jgi:hypothetical protein